MWNGDMKGRSVQFFANTRLKAKQFSSPKTGLITVYPLYATVIYGQSNTHLKVDFGEGTVLVSEDLRELKGSPLKQKAEEFRNRVVELIGKEESIWGEENFSLQGFSKRMKFYEHDALMYCLEIPLLRFIWALKHVVFKEGDIEKEAAVILRSLLMIEEFSFSKSNISTSIEEWQYGNGKNVVAEILNREVGREHLSTVMQVLDHFITNALYGEMRKTILQGD